MSTTPIGPVGGPGPAGGIQGAQADQAQPTSTRTQAAAPGGPAGAPQRRSGSSPDSFHTAPLPFPPRAAVPPQPVAPAAQPQGLAGSLTPDSLSHADGQLAAHQALLAHAATPHRVDNATAALNQAVKVGIGTAMTFGLGRSAGAEAATAINNTYSSPVSANTTPISASEAGLQVARAAVTLAGTAIGGGLMNAATPYLAAPLANLIPREFQKTDARAVVPDEMAQLMNSMDPGAGDALRQQAQTKQAGAAGLGSSSSIQAGELAFDTVNAIRGATQGAATLPPGTAIGVGTLVSALGGLGTGAGMALNQLRADVQVPQMDALREAAGRDYPDAGAKKDALAEVMAQHSTSVPLFHVRPPAASTAQAYGAAFSGSNLRVPQPQSDQVAPRTMQDQAADIARTAANVGAAVGDRSAELAKVTTAAVAVGVLKGMAMASADPQAARIIAAGADAVGIHTAVGPWFQKLTGDIPAHDAQRLSNNQATANAANLRRLDNAPHEV